MKLTAAQTFEKSLLDIWNEHDDVARMRAIRQYYSPDITFYEDDKKYTGHDELNNFVKNLQSQFPADVKFRIVTSAKVSNGLGRFGWELGVKNEMPVSTGIDVAIFKNGKIKDLYVFLD